MTVSTASGRNSTKENEEEEELRRFDVYILLDLQFFYHRIVVIT